MMKSLVREWYHKAIHPCFNLLNDLLYQLHENSRRPAAAAFEIQAPMNVRNVVTIGTYRGGSLGGLEEGKGVQLILGRRN